MRFGNTEWVGAPSRGLCVHLLRDVGVLFVFIYLFLIRFAGRSLPFGVARV